MLLRHYTHYNVWIIIERVRHSGAYRSMPTSYLPAYLLNLSIHTNLYTKIFAYRSNVYKYYCTLSVKNWKTKVRSCIHDAHIYCAYPYDIITYSIV